MSPVAPPSPGPSLDAVCELGQRLESVDMFHLDGEPPLLVVVHSQPDHGVAATGMPAERGLP